MTVCFQIPVHVALCICAGIVFYAARLILNTGFMSVVITDVANIAIFGYTQALLQLRIIVQMQRYIKGESIVFCQKIIRYSGNNMLDPIHAFGKVKPVRFASDLYIN